MAESRLDFSASDKPRQIQENMIAYMRLFADLPHMVMADDDVFWFVSNKPAPGNIVLRTRLPADHADTEIDGILTRIGQHIGHIDWFVFPCDQPSDLSQRLAARGMPGRRGGNWLWADLTSLGAGPTMPGNFRIEQVRDDRQMAEWIRVSEAGFGMNLALFHEAYSQHGYGPDAYSLHYTGYLDDTPVTSGTLLAAGGCAAVYDISTPPAFRRQGFAGAITHALMQESRRRGYADTWIWSSDMAVRVYRNLGYVEADFGLRAHTWHR